MSASPKRSVSQHTRADGQQQTANRLGGKFDDKHGAGGGASAADPFTNAAGEPDPFAPVNPGADRKRFTEDNVLVGEELYLRTSGFDTFRTSNVRKVAVVRKLKTRVIVADGAQELRLLISNGVVTGDLEGGGHASLYRGDDPNAAKQIANIRRNRAQIIALDKAAALSASLNQAGRPITEEQLADLEQSIATLRARFNLAEKLND